MDNLCETQSKEDLIACFRLMIPSLSKEHPKNRSPAFATSVEQVIDWREKTLNAESDEHKAVTYLVDGFIVCIFVLLLLQDVRIEPLQLFT